jgi:EAL domain-containing protein (putative c-di-GMP-specific phosphodiesterase class I)
MIDDRYGGFLPQSRFRSVLEDALRNREQHPRTFAVILVDLHPWMHLRGWTTDQGSGQLLETIRTRLGRLLRGHDAATPLDGNRFALFLHDVRDNDETALMAERALESASQSLLLNGEAVRPLVTVGATTAGPAHLTVDDLMADARSALHQARETDVTGYAVFDETVRLELDRRLGTLQAASNGDRQTILTLHYQPIIDLSDQTVIGAEALLRWNNPPGPVGTIPDLINIAERTGHIKELGQWVSQEAIREATTWAPQGIRTSINASPIELAHPRYADSIALNLDSAGLPPEALAIEVTESAALGKHAGSTLERLRHLGVGIWLDDFGTGYANLTSLVSLPIDTVKLDRSLLAGALDNGRTRAMVIAIVTMAHSLGLQVLAEGVETQTESDAAHGIGCDLAQGYLFGRPAPPTAMRDLIGRID